MFARQLKTKPRLTGRSESSGAGGGSQEGDEGFGELHLEVSECGCESGQVSDYEPNGRKAFTSTRASNIFIAHVVATKPRGLAVFKGFSTDMDENASDEWN